MMAIYRVTEKCDELPGRRRNWAAPRAEKCSARSGSRCPFRALRKHSEDDYSVQIGLPTSASLAMLVDLEADRT